MNTVAKEQKADTADTPLTLALSWLDKEQHDVGYWRGLLESNACMEAEWLLAFHVLGILDAHPLRTGLINGILNKQRDDGAWQIYYDAPNGDISTTVECYAALRCCGLDANHPQLTAASDWIAAKGGIAKVRVFTRFWLALIGEWPWQETPNLPPELVFFPRWFPFNIYNFASWARATLMPLCILSARETVVPLAPQNRLDALFPNGREHADYSLPHKPGAWVRFFLLADKALKRYQRWFKKPFKRDRAITLITEWVVRHQDADGSWGGIQPPWVYSLMALHQEGYQLDHPVMQKGIDTLQEHWSYQRDGATYIQACESPVWDTLLALMAYFDCGVSVTTAKLDLAVKWVLDKQVLSAGDWSISQPAVAAGGWAFERANAFYPDVDDTAVALIVLARAKQQYQSAGASNTALIARIDQAIKRAVDWVFAMQCKNGGWAAFDKDNDKDLLTKIPFSDFGETIDPPSVDVTAHVLEAFGHLGMCPTIPAIAHALDYVASEQETDGSWFGRWGVNHIYGTAAVLPAYEALGLDMQTPSTRRAAAWIAKHQNSDGGWGETCASYMDDSKRGKGPSTASQTAWAMMCLLAVDADGYAEALAAAEAYLTDHQTEQGTWQEPYFTGTGFPGYGIGKRTAQCEQSTLLQDQGLGKGFMINYNLYRHYFPLMALGRLRAHRTRA